MCHRILVLPFLQDVDVANARVGAERNPLKTEVIYCVNDLDAAPHEWKIGDVRSLAETSAVAAGSMTLGVAVGSRQFVTDQLLRRQMSSAKCTSASSSARIRRQSSPSFRKVWESAVLTASCGLTATKSWRSNRRQRSTMRSGSGLSNGSHRGQHNTSNPQCRPVRNWVQESVRHRCSCTPGSSHRSQTAHPRYDPWRSSGGPPP